MGGCFSVLTATPLFILEKTDGTEADYHRCYLEQEILGRGEFGVVKLVYDISQNYSTSLTNSQLRQHHKSKGKGKGTKDKKKKKSKNGSKPRPLACKILQKGVVFRDNTVYAPIKTHVLKGEVEMLQALRRSSDRFCHYCLQLEAVYESHRALYLITEFCAGGELMEYVANSKEDLRTEDVSRMADQLLTAVDHCARMGVLHRDIKPENIMFTHPGPKAPLRLIDFGSGTKDPKPKSMRGRDLAVHTTFAGSAFYISPEMFQRSYTCKTDIWSVGATLYVLVAGYPSDQLQKAFTIMQMPKNRNLKALPSLPQEGLPESFFKLLEACLTYRHKKRPSADQLRRNYDFCSLHVRLEEERGRMKLAKELAAAEAAAGELADPVQHQPQTQLDHQEQLLPLNTSEPDLFLFESNHAESNNNNDTDTGDANGQHTTLFDEEDDNLDNSFFNGIANDMEFLGDFDDRDANHPVQSLPTPASPIPPPPSSNQPQQQQHPAGSVSLRGSVSRHGTSLHFKKFERLLTTLLATILSKEKLKQLLKRVEQHLLDAAAISAAEAAAEEADIQRKRMAGLDFDDGEPFTMDETTDEETEEDDDDACTNNNTDATRSSPVVNGADSGFLTYEQKLSVIQVWELKLILQDEMRLEEVVLKMEDIPNAIQYDTHAYHVNLLREFSRDDDDDDDDGYEEENSSRNSGGRVGGRKKKKRRRSFRRSGSFGTPSTPSHQKKWPSPTPVSSSSSTNTAPAQARRRRVSALTASFRSATSFRASRRREQRPAAAFL